MRVWRDHPESAAIRAESYRDRKCHKTISHKDLWPFL
jgi:hypothetical protein